MKSCPRCSEWADGKGTARCLTCREYNKVKSKYVDYPTGSFSLDAEGTASILREALQVNGRKRSITEQLGASLSPREAFTLVGEYMLLLSMEDIAEGLGISVRQARRVSERAKASVLAMVKDGEITP